ncbi:hypothetical protein D4764_05G0008300 [Takifugu flavidus]|uniref:Uncharacterized protein n=1 Tax=Takifugu flavidus TaxID=433684 RepID=A0A5C6N4U2_9TELE|nr:hypothetical protein D4764_05G0008300 [Takifugu flavidus]
MNRVRCPPPPPRPAATTCTDHTAAVAVRLHKTHSHVPPRDVSRGDFPCQCVRRTLRSLPRLTGTRFSLFFGFSLHLRSVSFTSIDPVSAATPELSLAPSPPRRPRLMFSPLGFWTRERKKSGEAERERETEGRDRGREVRTRGSLILLMGIRPADGGIRTEAAQRLRG